MLCLALAHFKWNAIENLCTIYIFAMVHHISNLMLNNLQILPCILLQNIHNGEWHADYHFGKAVLPTRTCTAQYAEGFRDLGIPFFIRSMHVWRLNVYIHKAQYLYRLRIVTYTTEAITTSHSEILALAIILFAMLLPLHRQYRNIDYRILLTFATTKIN